MIHPLTFEELPSTNSLYIKKNYPDFYNYLLSNYPDTLTSTIKFTEKLYLFYHNQTTPNKCPICGNKVQFLNINKGYQQYCSLRCSNNSDDVKKKKEATTREHYGVDHPCQNQEVKQKLIRTYISNNGGMGNASKTVKEKQLNTMLSTYGHRYALQCAEFMEKNNNTRIINYGSIENSYIISRSKARNTNIQKYGVSEVLGLPEIQSKIIDTNIKKYGVPYTMLIDDIHKKSCRSRQNNQPNKYPDLLYINEFGTWALKCPHPECNLCNEKYYEVDYHMYYDRKKDGTELCTRLLPPNKYPIHGTSIEMKVRNFLDSEGISYISNDRNILNGKELDIYIPSHNIAIECNGIYWHSSNNPIIRKPYNNHWSKWKLCEESGIQLITLWQDWINCNWDIVESLLRSKLGLIRKSIYARQCRVVEIDKKSCSKFLKENHIQGHTGTTYRYGLYHNGELVSVMTFSINDHKEMELTRFCNKLNTNVIGGASRLLCHFLQEHPQEKIVSFSSHDISNGNLYKQLGFEQDRNSITYWYITNKCDKRYHRCYGRKDNIISRGEAPSSNKSEWKESEVMFNNGYFQIYDSGMTKWILKKTS